MNLKHSHTKKEMILKLAVWRTAKKKNIVPYSVLRYGENYCTLGVMVANSNMILVKLIKVLHLKFKHTHSTV